MLDMILVHKAQTITRYDILSPINQKATTVRYGWIFQLEQLQDPCFTVKAVGYVVHVVGNMNVL